VSSLYHPLHEREQRRGEKYVGDGGKAAHKVVKALNADMKRKASEGESMDRLTMREEQERRKR
jgi:hypothetical protein